MIHDHKPNGYFYAYNELRNRVEGETRQCVHCQFMWIYQPGSGDQRGYCLNCNGFICARPECYAQQQRLTEKYLALTSRVRGCIPFEEWNNRIREKVEKYLPLDPALTVTESGIIVRRSSVYPDS